MITRTNWWKAFFMLPAILLLWAAVLTGEPSETAKASVDLSSAIIRVAKQNIPAVVHIEVTERQEVENPYSPFENDPLFRQYYNVPRMPRKFKREVKGLGSGMIIDDQGHILTNHHVAGGATRIDVMLADGRRFEAKLVGADPKTDLAVIRIQAKGPLPHVTFGDSNKAEVGEWVVAIGHPRGLDQTVTQGIISAKHRQGVTDPGSYQDYLQTDAAINPGNSGGPLLNLRGEVIGVNAAIASESGGFEGIGFTIPSNMATYVARELIAHGKVERGWLGVTIQDVTAVASERSGRSGVLIADVVKGGPADKAGIKKDDVIIAFNGNPVADSGTFRNDVASTPIGRETSVTVLRDGKQLEKKIRVGNLREATDILIASLRERIGAELRPVSIAEAEKYGLDEGQGLTVSKVILKGPLGKAGFEVGDIILEINEQVVGTLEELAELVAQLRPRQRITVLALDHRSGEAGLIQIVVQ